MNVIYQVGNILTGLSKPFQSQKLFNFLFVEHSDR